MNHLLLVALGGGAGAAARHLVNGAALRLAGPGFPFGTLAVNVTGSLAMGLLVGWLAQRGSVAGATDLRLLLATGFLGGFTTFSAFSLDAVMLWRGGAGAMALVYVGASVVLSIIALVAGLGLTRSLA